jgi:hypothetical protein
MPNTAECGRHEGGRGVGGQGNEVSAGRCRVLSCPRMRVNGEHQKSNTIDIVLNIDDYRYHRNYMDLP